MSRSVMKHSFAEVPRANVPRSSFNRSHGLKTTFDLIILFPCLSTTLCLATRSTLI